MLPTLTAQNILQQWPTQGALWLIENPQFAETHTVVIKQAILIATEQHLEFLQDAYRMSVPTILAALAKNPHTPISLLQSLFAEPNFEIQVNLAQNPCLPVDMLRMLAQNHQHDKDIIRCLSENPATPADLLLLWAQKPTFAALMGIAQHPHAPSEALHALLFPKFWYTDWPLMQAVLANPHVSAQTLDSVFQEVTAAQKDPPVFPKNQKNAGFVPDLWVRLRMLRSALAIHPNASVSLLWNLAADVTLDVRIHVAQNLHTPVELLELLAEDVPVVQLGLLQNPHVPAELHKQLCEQLSASAQDEIRVQLAQTPSCHPQILEKLAADTYYPVCLAVAQNTHAPLPALLALSQHPYYPVRYAVAQNPHTHAVVLEQLAKGLRYPTIRAAVAKHPQVSEEMIATLQQDWHESVRIAASDCAQSRGFTLHSATKQWEQEPLPSLLQQWASALRSHETHEYTDDAINWDSDEMFDTIFQLISSEDTPLWAAQVLSDDVDLWVRQAAAKRQGFIIPEE